MLVIYDLEYTTWPGAQRAHWGDEGQRREIVQAAAIRLDDDLVEVTDQTWFVRPQRNPEVSAYLTNLTGITQDQVDAGCALPAFYSEFATFCDGFPALSYGNDMVILGENVGDFEGGLGEFRSVLPAMLNIRPYINNVLPQTRPLSAGQLWTAIEVLRPTDAREHDALDDCRAVAATLREISTTRRDLLDVLALSRQSMTQLL